MQIQEIKNEGLELHFKVQIPSETFSNKVNTKLQKIAPTLKLPGFRPGKVPIKIVEQRYKASIVQEELQDVINTNIDHIVKQNNIKLASEVRVQDLSVQDGKDVEFTVILERMPEIADINFSDLEVDKPEVIIPDEAIEAKLNDLALLYSNYTPAPEGANAKLGDKLIIDFEGFIDDVPFDGGKAEKHELVLGSKVFIEGFEDQLVGTKAGQTLSVNVVFPENYGAKNLAAKKSEFKVYVHEILQKDNLDHTEEMLAKFNAKDLDEVKERIKAVISTGHEETTLAQTKLNLFDKLESMLTFEVPKTLFETEKKHLLSEVNTHNHNNQHDTELAEDSESYCSKLALRRVRIGLMLASYADKNGIKVSQEEQFNEIKKQIMQMPHLENKIIHYYKTDPSAIKVLTGSILEDKAVRHILEHKVKINLVKYSMEEYKKLLDGE
ncbi:MAG: trigger factor [Rickettsiaceae bacterium]|nr:trigger factor [Rickettsiaceae bacterium]